jgi:hypothetical protein
MRRFAPAKIVFTRLHRVSARTHATDTFPVHRKMYFTLHPDTISRVVLVDHLVDVGEHILETREVQDAPGHKVATRAKISQAIRTATLNPDHGELMPKPPNYKQQKKQREDTQKRRNEQEQQRKSERKNNDAPFDPPFH